MKDHKSRIRFRQAIKAAERIASKKTPTPVKAWLRRVYHQELDEIEYLLSIANKPEGIEVRRT